MKYYTQNPYSWNYIAVTKKQEQRKEEAVRYTPSALGLAMKPEYVLVSKFLGIEDKSDWNKYYDKVYQIVQWAKQRTQSNRVQDWIYLIKDKLAVCPKMNDKRFLDLLVAIKLENFKTEQDFNGNRKELY